MYRDPILWNGNQQLLGEEVMVYMNDSTIDWAHIHNQTLSVEKLDSVNYNQVTGKDMKAYFTNGEMHRVDVIGSVRVIYYPMEKDSTLMGMNVMEGGELNMYLENRKLTRGVMFPQPKGTFYPMDQLPPKQMKLDNFAWFDYIRPLNKQDIFNWRAKSADQVLKKSTRSGAPLPNQNLFKKDQVKKEQLKKEE